LSCGNPKSDYLLKVYEQPGEAGAAGYVSVKGDTVIPAGKYAHCYTDTIKTFGIVMTQDKRLIGIDKNQKELFEVFWFDNGPDYVSDGLFRIVKDNKIGYADENGKITIEPQYDCAYPFENGVAKVSRNCTTTQDGEHTTWESDHWEVIHKDGK
ncbi:unnamed protein product, partial [Phaeothamnion confervicola]